MLSDYDEGSVYVIKCKQIDSLNFVCEIMLAKKNINWKYKSQEIADDNNKVLNRIN